MLPANLDDWNLDRIKGLLRKRIFESDQFDFKECLPKKRANRSKRRMRKTCCAFANSYGGYLVFGVKDDRDLPPDERLVGLPSSLDFPEHFGSYPSSCMPSVTWDFRKEPILLGEEMCIHIVKIEKSLRKPHAIAEDDKWTFPKRTNKGNETMTYEEINLAFTGYERKRARLLLIVSELEMLKKNAKEAYFEDPNRWKDEAPFADLSTSVLETAIGEVYDILLQDMRLIEALKAVRYIAGKLRVVQPAALVWMANRDHFALEHYNGQQRTWCKKLIEHCDVAIDLIEALRIGR